MSSKDASPEARKLAKTMNKSDVEDFASTKTKNLPDKKEHVLPKKLKEYIQQVVADELNQVNEVTELFGNAMVKWSDRGLEFYSHGSFLFDISEDDTFKLLKFLKRYKHKH